MNLENCFNNKEWGIHDNPRTTMDGKKIAFLIGKDDNNKYYRITTSLASDDEYVRISSMPYNGKIINPDDEEGVIRNDETLKAIMFIIENGGKVTLDQFKNRDNKDNT